MKQDRKQIALVTGASSGMGRCFVRKIAENYPFLHEIWVIARREEALDALQKELPETELKILVCDLSDRQSFPALEELLKQESPRIRLLVNGAGLGHNGPVERQAPDGICSTVDVNCRALMVVTRICLPYLGRGSRVIQMASGSAFLPQPGFAVYAASKACVLSFSRALREELRHKKISVTAVCPGPVRTDFFRAGGISISPVKKMFLAEPEKVVERALEDAARGKAVSVYGISMKLVRLAAAVLPEGLLIWLSGKLFRNV